MISISDIEKLHEVVKRLRASIIRKEKIIDREFDYESMTQKAFQKRDVDVMYANMEVEKLELEAHVAMVNAGLADVREKKFYEAKIFHVSPFHKYKYTPPLPRCLQKGEP